MKKSSVKRTPARKFLRGCLGLPLLLLLIGGLGIVVGIPGAWVMPWVNPKMPQGFLLEASELRYLPGEGFLFSELKLYGPRDLVTPLVQAESFQVNPHFLKRLRSQEWFADLHIQEGEMKTNLGTWADDLQTDKEVHLHGIEGGLEFEPGKVHFKDIQGSLPNIDVLLTGEIELGVPSGDPGPPMVPRVARVIAEIMGFIENFQFEEPPRIEAAFSSASTPSNTPRIQLRLNHQGASRHRGFAFEKIEAEATYENRIFLVHSFLVQENAERFISGSARVDFEQEGFEVDLENTLRRVGLEAISPFALGNVLDWLQLRLEDRCDFKMTMGPNTFAQPGNKIMGEFQVGNGFYRDAFFPELSLKLHLDYPYLKIYEVEGVLGKGKGQGPIAGEIELNFNTGMGHVRVDGGFYPDYAVSMVGDLTEKYLREWEFLGPAPQFSARYDLKETGAPMFFSVVAEGKDVLWRGTAFDAASCKVVFEDRQLSITGARARRGKELVEAELLFDPGFTGCTFDVKSNFYLPDVLQLIGPQAAKWVQSFRFQGTSELESKGYVDFTSDAVHDLQGSYTFNDLVWNWLSVKNLSGTVNLDEQVLQLPDIKASLEGGGLNANLRVDEPFGEQGRFVLAMHLKEMDLYKVITKATDLEDTPYKGRLSLELNLMGMVKDSETLSRFDSLAGVGRMEIKEGSLFRVPLLLGLSQILSKIVSGFGYASQSDFSADFEIGKGKVWSKELFLQGNVLSIAGPGSYSFADRKISADLKIHLLKDGILSDALKLILWPIRKLIEVQLTGTLDHPDWQPKNLPKEIFGK
ncbi:AsmA-like C-terminal region-containing protein [Kiritimatiellaeota bacterium B1221]|nr:AsmA-like C-terminal region-containing protein [Kiritimatiellaeota bacterium B1221]